MQEPLQVRYLEGFSTIRLSNYQTIYDIVTSTVSVEALPAESIA